MKLTLSRPPPHHRRRSREADQLVQLDQGSLEGPLDEGLVLFSQRHLQRDERGPEGGQRTDDAQDVVFLKPAAVGGEASARVEHSPSGRRWFLPLLEMPDQIVIRLRVRIRLGHAPVGFLGCHDVRRLSWSRGGSGAARSTRLGRLAGGLTVFGAAA